MRAIRIPPGEVIGKGTTTLDERETTCPEAHCLCKRWRGGHKTIIDEDIDTRKNLVRNVKNDPKCEGSPNTGRATDCRSNGVVLLCLN